MSVPIFCHMVCTGKRLTKTGCDIVLSPVLKGKPGTGKPYVWMQLGSIILSYPTQEAYKDFILGDPYDIESTRLLEDDEFSDPGGVTGKIIGEDIL